MQGRRQPPVPSQRHQPRHYVAVVDGDRQRRRRAHVATSSRFYRADVGLLPSSSLLWHNAYQNNGDDTDGIVDHNDSDVTNRNGRSDEDHHRFIPNDHTVSNAGVMPNTTSNVSTADDQHPYTDTSRHDDLNDDSTLLHLNI